MQSKNGVIRGIHYKTKKPIALSIKHGRVASMCEETGKMDAGRIIAPGFVDLQINGYMGHDFNQSGMDAAAWKRVTDQLLSAGVSTFYPTLITNSYDRLESLFREYAGILQGNPMVGGFHLEGPFISSQDGPRGAHAKTYVRKPDWDRFCRLQDAASGMIKIITISPEYDAAPSFTERAVLAGVKVAIGHTAATSEQIAAVVTAGASFSTHLGNGSHPVLPRHHNYVWDQLAEDRLFATVIADGHHLPSNLLKVFERTKRHKLLLVSDSVMLAGLPPGDYRTEIGGDVTLTDTGFLHLKGNPGIFAGSAQHILHGVNHLVRNRICGFAEAIEKASVLPAKLMGLPQKRGVEAGAVADIIVMKQSPNGIDIMEVYKRGVQVFKRTDGTYSV